MNQIKALNEVKVSLNFGRRNNHQDDRQDNSDEIITVGRLARRDQTIYFEYDSAFIPMGLEISPLQLALEPGLRRFDPHLFEGLPGVFNDSLPDGWGRLLFDRWARSQGFEPSQLSPLHRLSVVGHHGMGALVYEPDNNDVEVTETIYLDELAEQAQQVLDGESSDVLEQLIALNGSSAGARPKALIGVNQNLDHMIHRNTHHLPDDYTGWLVKFPNTQDGIDAGAVEYVYALMAKEAGIEMPAVHLFPTQRGPGFFASQCFDRERHQRYHMHTACGLLHSDFRTPALDYEDLLALTGMLTRDVRQVERMYQLAVFNVLAHNRDDHSKNFSFLMDRAGNWRLAPAYDLTFSFGPSGEQSTMVMGEGRNPSMSQLLKLGQQAQITSTRMHEIIEQTQYSLSKWSTLAQAHGVSKQTIARVQEKLDY